MRVNIVGNGVWGNALFKVISKNCSEVSILNKGEKTSNADVFVLSVPTQSIRDVLVSISLNDEAIIVNTAKGIEKSSHLLPFQIVQNVLGNNRAYFTLIGPSFAGEVKKEMPTLVNLGCLKESATSIKIKNLFQTNFFRVKLTSCVNVLELSAAFKNIYAIACGLTFGLGYGTNTRIKILCLAIDEMSSLYKGLGWKTDSNITPGTIGDLILTSNSAESRNFMFGVSLAKLDSQKALEKVNSTVEGYHSLASVEHFEKQAKVKLPLADFIKSIVEMNNPKRVKKEFEHFVSLI